MHVDKNLHPIIGGVNATFIYSRMRNIRKLLCRRTVLLRFAMALLVLYCVHQAMRDYAENAVYHVSINSVQLFLIIMLITYISL